jgi:hypothetical protein
MFLKFSSNIHITMCIYIIYISIVEYFSGSTLFLSKSSLALACAFLLQENPLFGWTKKWVFLQDYSFYFSFGVKSRTSQRNFRGVAILVSFIPHLFLVQTLSRSYFYIWYCEALTKRETSFQCVIGVVSQSKLEVIFTLKTTESFSGSIEYFLIFIPLLAEIWCSLKD